jgi:protein-tyrosine phosphatase
MAEYALRQQLQGDHVEVCSAGTGAPVGSAPPREVIDVMEPFGLGAVRDHRASQLTPIVLQDVSLVLAATRKHRTDAVRMRPDLGGRAFTFLELQRIAERVGDRMIVKELQAEPHHAMAVDAVPADPLNAAITAAARTRGLVLQSASPDALDVPDPYQGPLMGYREALDQIMPAMAAVADLLARAARLGLAWQARGGE